MAHVLIGSTAAVVVGKHLQGGQRCSGDSAAGAWLLAARDPYMWRFAQAEPAQAKLRSSDGQGPLFWAIEQGNKVPFVHDKTEIKAVAWQEIVRMLVRAGADTEAEDKVRTCDAKSPDRVALICCARCSMGAQRGKSRRVWHYYYINSPRTRFKTPCRE